jgi:rhodanese-related sulfurtransferase
MTVPTLHRLVQRCGPAGLTPAQAAAAVRAKQAVLVDASEPAAWMTGVAKHAVRLPMGDFTGARELWGPFLATAGAKPLLVYGRSCTEAAAAVRALHAAGITQAVDAGTLQEWDDAGWPVCRPRRHR